MLLFAQVSQTMFGYKTTLSTGPLLQHTWLLCRTFIISEAGFTKDITKDITGSAATFLSSDTADTEGDRADTEGDITVTSADFLGFIIAAGLTDVEAGFTDVNGTSATFMDFVYAAGLVDTGLTDTEAGITDLSTEGTEDFAKVEVDFEGSMDNLRLLFGPLCNAQWFWMWWVN